MNDDAPKLEARLTAIEHVLTHVTRAVYLVANIPDTVIAAAHANIRAGLQEETFPRVNPALSDHFSAEISEAADKILKNIERVMAEARGQTP